MFCAVCVPTAYAKTFTAVNTTEVIRLSGATRYDTACDVSQEINPEGASPSDDITSSGDAVSPSDTEARYVIIANGTAYADALAGVPLAENLEAPILLTSGQGELEDCVMQEIKRLGANRAIILGGDVAVSPLADAQLGAAGVSVERLSGATRYDTAVKIADYNSALFPVSSTLFLTSGENFPDALSAGAVAGRTNSSILFCTPDGNIRQAAADFICRSGILKVVIVGGTSAVSASAETNLRNLGVTVERISGETRYDTSIEVYKKYVDVFSDGIVSFATGANFPDALTGGVLSAIKGAPVLLVRNLGENRELEAMLDRIDIDTAYVYGGTSVVAESIVTALLRRDVTFTTTTTTRPPTTVPTSSKTKNYVDVLNPNYRSKYYIIVYTDSCNVIVLGKDSNGKYTQIVKNFLCSVGKSGKSTPAGLYSIDKRYDWRLMFGNVYAQYAVRFYGNYLFHSVPYYTESPDDLEMEEFEKLGKPASLGCVRLCVRDCKWIYDNAPNGTQVRVISGKKGPSGTLPIPELLYDSEHYGWDPTDPDPRNPYNK